MLEDALGSTFFGQVVDETNPGRSLKIESPFTSSGTVMLYGDPELATIKGLRRKR